MHSCSFTSEEYQDDEDLKCPKCSYFFSSSTKPYILPCNHNICMDCIDKLIEEKKTFCPICNIKFEKDERKNFEVNFGFLNLMIKILETKIIFCTKCNKIYYWKEHYKCCEQKYFENGSDLLDDIKTAFEDGEKVLNFTNAKTNLLSKYKSEVNKLVTYIISEINKKFCKNVEKNIKNEILNIKTNINFYQSKMEILNFLKLCLTYPQNFNIVEIKKTIQV